MFYREKTWYKKLPQEKKIEYSPLAKQLEVQTDIGKKQYKGLGKAFISNNNNKNVNESSSHSLSFESKYSCLINFL